MADSNQVPYGGYSPEMDGAAHEATYRGFVRFAEIGVTFVICIVLSLAVGGMRHAWLSAVVGVVLAHLTSALGLFAPGIAWRANVGVAVLLLLLLLIYR